MKWAVRWDDYYGEPREEFFDSLAEAITHAEEFNEDVERVRLFYEENHVATYYTPTKGHWE